MTINELSELRNETLELYKMDGGEYYGKVAEAITSAMNMQIYLEKEKEKFNVV